MTQNKSRHQVSVRGETHRRLRDEAQARGIRIIDMVEIILTNQTPDRISKRPASR